MTLTEWTKRLAEAREEIQQASSDREAIVRVFAELATLLLDIKATIDGDNELSS